MTEQSLPASMEAEQSTLGCVLLNREAIIPIASWLRPNQFFWERNRWIYEAMLACFDTGTPPDTRTIADQLTRANRFDAIGGYLYLNELSDAVPTSYHVESYARIVERAAIDRELISVGGRIAALGYDQGADADTKIAHAYRELDGATAQRGDGDFLTPIADLIEREYAAMEAADRDGTDIQNGIPTGFRDLDELLGGLHKQDLIILAARPSVGKSSLAQCIAHGVAGAGYRVDIFSLEMSAKQTLHRLIAIDSGVDTQHVQHYKFSQAQKSAYMVSLGRLDSLPIAIDDRPALTIADIRSRILRRGAQIGMPSLVVIDYLQLMSTPRQRENRTQDVSEISRGLKALAKELDCPIIALSQLSRAVEGRTSHVPMLSDLRESGAIEQDSDIVLFIYREELYDKDTDKKGIAELHIAKHRSGPIGVVLMRFDAPTTRFQALTYRTPSGVYTEESWPNND
jgi:replicative DNA helicase